MPKLSQKRSAMIQSADATASVLPIAVFRLRRFHEVSTNCYRCPI